MPDQIIPLVHVIAQMIRPRRAHRLLFAYDELIEEYVIREPCPDPGLHLHGPSQSRRFIVNPDGLASIVPRQNHVVHRIVWELLPAHNEMK